MSRTPHPLNATHRRAARSRARSALLSRALTVALALTAVPLAPLAPRSVCAAPQPTQQASMESLRDQGLLYFSKKMIPLAREQFELAYKTPTGPQDFRVVYYRAKTAYMQLNLEVAFEMAELATQLASESRDKSESQKLLDELKGQFSYVQINAAKEETNKRGRIYLETKRRILNQTKREQFESIRTRFRSMDVDLPTKIYLPYGNYTANNAPFNIEQGDSSQVPSVEIFLQIVQGDGPKQSNTLLYTVIGVGGAALIATGALLLFGNDPETKERTIFSIGNSNSNSNSARP
jgi:hypothetical protein